MQTLVGQTFIRSYKEKGVTVNAQLTVLDEVIDKNDNTRKYIVKNLNENNVFRADAETYDRLYLVKRGEVKSNKFQKGNLILSPAHPEYKIRK